MYLSVWLYYFLSIINHELYFADSEATDSSSDDEVENKVSKFLVAGLTVAEVSSLETNVLGN